MTTVNRLTSYATISQLFNSYDIYDLLHTLLRNRRPKLFVVASDIGGPLGCFFLFTDALNFLLDRIQKIVYDQGEEYSQLYYYDGETNQKVFVSREELCEYILRNFCCWEGEEGNYVIDLISCYPDN
jgi:hypothetical protein